MLVKNMHSENMQIPGGALNAWKHKKGYKESDTVYCVRCEANGSRSIAKHGGHVIKADPNATKERYIVPLCVGCNELKDDEPFEVLFEDMVKVTDLQ